MRFSAGMTAGTAVTALAILGQLGCSPTSSPGGAGGPVRALSIAGDSLHKLAANPAVWSAPRSFQRKCVGAFGCGFLKRVTVQVYADTGARNVGPNPSTGPTLVGKLENTGNATEAMYGLQNGPYDFLLYVLPGSGGANGRWVIERVGKAPPYAHVTVSEGIQAGCNHPTPWNSSFGEFRSCADGPPPNPPRSARMGVNTPSGIRTAGFNLFASFIALQAGGQDPIWLTCTSGCCVSDAPQFLPFAQ